MKPTKSVAQIKADLESRGLTPAQVENLESGLLTSLSDDLLEDVSAGAIHVNGHGNVVLT